MKVEIVRTYRPGQTIGEFFIDDVEFCKTLELPWLDNKRSKSCIPEGTYNVIKQPPKPSRNYEYFRIQNVAGRSGILIHTGNFTRQILGCILVGATHKDIDADGLTDVTQSTVTLKALCARMPNDFSLIIRKKRQ